MMNPRDYKIASELKRRLGKVVELKDFKVYGSRARGDDDEFSDLDVFVEVTTLDGKTKPIRFHSLRQAPFESLRVCDRVFDRPMSPSTFLGTLRFSKGKVEWLAWIEPSAFLVCFELRIFSVASACPVK